jgi:hypothetical protein
MIGLFLVLLAALLFAQAWYFLGLYADARTFGFIAAALAVGLAASVGGSFESVIIAKDAALPLLAFRGFVILWAVYGAAVAAHALWGFEERAIGFHSLFLWAASMLYLIGFTTVFDPVEVSNNAAIVFGGSALVLSIISAMVFFHLAIPFRELRTVAGWFLLVGSIFVAALGMTVLFGILG